MPPTATLGAAGRKVAAGARKGLRYRNFDRVNGKGVWSDKAGKVTGYSDEEDSKITPVEKYIAQRRRARTKGYT